MRKELDDALRLDPAQKRAFLAKLLRPQEKPAGPTPLSFAQRRLWLLDRIEPGRATYNVSFAVRLRGALDAAALERALNDIVRRHDVLRAVIGLVEGEPVQCVADAYHLELPLVELATLEPPASLEPVLAEHAHRIFDLGAFPAIRALLVRASPDDHVLSIAMHHIVTDGWSMSVFKRELRDSYDAYRGGRTSPLRVPARSYADFATWQRERLGGAFLEGRVQYWKAQLCDAPPSFELVPQVTRSARTSRGRAESRCIARATRDALHALSREHRSTLFCTLFAAFVTLLHRYSGRRDIVVGSAVANRTSSEFEETLGFFVNTLPLRTRIAGDPTFSALLVQVTAATLEAFDNQDLPFEKLVEALHPARSATRTPLVNVMFVLQNTPDEPLRLAGLDVTPIAVECTTAKFDLTLQVTDSPDGLALSLEYSTDLYEAATIAALLAAFDTLLCAVACDAERPLSQLPLLSPAAERRQLIEWNDTARALENCRIEGLFERNAALAPHAVALETESERLSYGALNARANRLARYLQSLGVRPADRVGLCFERSANMVVGMLAALKAGAAYVPLDPGYPPARLAFVLRDAGVRVVLTERRFLGCLKGVPVRAFCLDEATAALDACADTNRPASGTGADLAYIMYTSGSSGTPKGVMIPHRAVERLVCNTNYVRITAAHVVAHTSNVSFDASTFEVWAPLLNGARLAIVPRAVLLSPHALAKHIAAYRITVMFLTTALFREIAREAPGSFRELEYLLVGGEALSVDAARLIAAPDRPAHLLNAYGPTEATTFATYHAVGNSTYDHATIPIGRPISNTEVLILDERRKLLPLGAAGELYIGGAGLALGYVDDAALTAQKFVDHPLRPNAGTKLYATGDVARHLPSGDIEFIGRLDGQLKVRGFRIEPAEVEAALRALGAVNDAAVIARDDASGNKQLVGYISVAEPRGFDVAAVGRLLRRRLPPHLVPDIIVALAAFPLTASGKLDRAALSAAPLRAAVTPDVRAGSELQAQLLLMWQKLLNVRPIGIRDNFFALGGHSLLAVRLIADIEHAFQTRLPLAVLFEDPTIEHLADALVRDAGNPNRARLVALHAGGSAPPLFFLHGSLTGGGYYCLALARRLGADRPLYLLRPHGVDGLRLPASIEAMAAEYVDVVRTVQAHGPYLLGGFCSGGLVAFAMARLLRERGETVSNLILVDVPRTSRALRTVAQGIDRYGTLVKIGPVLRAALVRSIARFPQHVRRLAQSPSKSAFVRARLPIIAELLARAVRAEPSPGGGFENAGPRNLLKEWKQISEAYVPRRYDGRVTVLLSRDAQRVHRPDADGWSTIAPQVDVRTLRGDHFSCITEYVDDTADALASALAAV